MKVVLIYPPNNMHRAAYNVKSSKRRKYGHQPPLCLGYVAAIAENHGHEVEIVDGEANGFSLEECAGVVRDHKPDLVGISVMTNVKNESAKLAEHIKKALPDTPIIVGGAHAYYFHSTILDEMPEVDFVLYGEIENSWGEFLDNLNNHDSWASIKGLCYRNSAGSIVMNQPPDIIKDLDVLPMPSWHLFDFSLYRPLPFQLKGDSFFSLMTSRGCAYGKCAFCFQAGSKKQPYRRHSPARMVKEITLLRDRYNITDIAFWDDTFSANVKWLGEFKTLLEKEDLHVNWTCSTKASYITKENIKLMKEAGCWSIFLGIESGDQELLDLIEKGSSLEQAKAAVALANGQGIETRCAYMLGLPGETPESANKTIEFAKEMDSTFAIFYATHPRYGTKLYDMALSYGNFVGSEFKGMTGITYLPDGYSSAEQLQRMIRKAYTRFYLRPGQVLKFAKKIRSFSDLKEAFLGLELFLGLRN